MTSLEPHPVTLPVALAMEAADLEGVLDAFAPDAVLRSPLTDRLAFVGREQIAAITAVLLDTFEGLHYTAEVRGEHSAFLVGEARVDGREIEIADHLRLGPDGRIVEQTVFFRPLPAAAVALRVLGAGLGRRRSPALGAAIGGLTRPLGTVAGLGDAIGVRFVRSTL